MEACGLHSGSDEHGLRAGPEDPTHKKKILTPASFCIVSDSLGFLLPSLSAFLAAGLLGRASLSNLRCSKPLMMPSRAYDRSRKLEVTPTLDSFRFQQFLDPALLMSPVPMHSRRLQLE